MKRLLLGVLLFSSSLFADITWLDYDDAIELAEKNNKIVMVLLSREGCSACEYMKDVALKNKDVSEYIQKHFIAVEVDIQQDFIPEGLSYFGTPTFHFLDKNEKKLDRINGGKNSKSFMEYIQKVKTAQEDI